MERDGGGVGGSTAVARPAEVTADMAEKVREGGGTAAAAGDLVGGAGRVWSVGLRRQYRMPAALMAFPAAGDSDNRRRRRPRISEYKACARGLSESVRSWPHSAAAGGAPPRRG